MYQYYNNGHYKFEGNLLNSITGPGCDQQNDTYKDCYDSCISLIGKDGICDRFAAWHIAGAAHIAFESIAILISLAILVILFLDINEKANFKIIVVGILMFVVFLSHFLAFAIWAAIVQVRFSGNCDYDILYPGIEPVCVSSGAIFSLTVLIYLAIFCGIILHDTIKLRKTDGPYKESIINYLHFRDAKSMSRS